MKKISKLLMILLFVSFSYSFELSSQNDKLISFFNNQLDYCVKLSDILKRDSQFILNASEVLINSASDVNKEYIYAMLKLADDIGVMADRIGLMADRILFTEEQIGIMSDRILETQRIQSENLKITEENLLRAQKNLNLLLK